MYPPGSPFGDASWATVQLEIVDVLRKSDLALKGQDMRPRSTWGEVPGRYNLSRRTKAQAASEPSLVPEALPAHEAEGSGLPLAYVMHALLSVCTSSSSGPLQQLRCEDLPVHQA